MAHFGARLKVEPRRFPNALGVECESKKEIKDNSKVFGSSHWKGGIAIVLDV